MTSSGLPGPFDSDPGDCNDFADRAAKQAVRDVIDVPETWARPAGFTGPCPECGSTTCRGYYKPDGNHFLPF